MRTVLIVIVSAISGIVLFVAGILLFTEGSNIRGEVESHIIFYDELYKQSVLKELDQSDIPYRKDGESSIYYPAKYQKDMDELKAGINLNYPRIFNVYRESMIVKFSNKLEKSGIPYEIYEIENGKSFVIDSEYGQLASEIFNSIRG